MDATLIALGGLLLKAIPTFVLFLLLHFYLKYVFFKPLDKVLKSRFDATEGARAAARQSLDNAAKKASEYEEAIRNARSEIFREQEQFRADWRKEQSEAVAAARAEAGAMVKQAREQLAADAAGARSSLQVQSEMLASQITDRMLQGRAS